MTEDTREYLSGAVRSLNDETIISFAIRGDLSFFKGRGGRFLYLKITETTGTGRATHPDPIYLDDLFDCIVDALRIQREDDDPDGNGYFTADDLVPGIQKGGRNRNTNLPGFAAAVLDVIGLVTCINETHEDGRQRTSGHKFRLPEINVAGGEAAG